MKTNSDKELSNFLLAVGSVENHYFEKIIRDKKKRSNFLNIKCSYCQNNNNFPDSCYKIPSFDYLNCYLHSIRKYFNVKYSINWMTVTLFPPSTEAEIINFNLADDVKKTEKFYRYFGQNDNYSASKSIFVDKIKDIKVMFPNTEIFVINYADKKINVKDALDSDEKNILTEDTSEENFNNYTTIMEETSGTTLNFLYFFIYKNFNPLSKTELFSGLYIPSDTEYSNDVLNEIAVLTKIFLTPIEKTRSLVLLSDEFDKKIGYSMKAAIAAIMSRNGSHNIGSHVLSAVSDGISDPSDDRILFNYIQERMDFIAQITTETPKWTFPTSLIQDLIRRFYIQRHLLNYISYSEGLTAYEFQGKNSGGEQENKLIIKILNKSGEEIVGLNNNDENQSIKDFVQIAVPGGVIGQQAFFTILENIIRNTAKHNWANSNFKKDAKNLEVTVQYNDYPDNDYVLIQIYDNVSNVFINDNKLTEEEKERIAKQLLNYVLESKNKPLHQQINEKLIAPFVDEDTGQLRNENWGLAEIKICSAFLNKKNVNEYGLSKKDILYDEAKNKLGFISTIGKNDDKGIYHLCYQLKIPKPREVLIIGASIFINDNDKLEAKKFGVYFKDEPPTDLDYEIVVFMETSIINSDEIIKKEKYPFRLVCFNGDKNNLDKLISSRIQKIKEPFKKYFDGLNNLESRLNKWEKLKLSIYKEWLMYFVNRRNNDLILPIDFYIRHKEKSKSSSNPNNEFDNFISHFEINDNSKKDIKKVLVKYDEDIETLPKIFRAKYANEQINREFVIKPDEIIQDLTTSGKENKARIQLKRHFKAMDMPSNNNTYLYQESLSGSQIYFNLFENELNDYQKNKFMLQLLENALIRILIIDERFLAHFEKKDINHKNAINNANLKTFYKIIYNGKEKPIKSGAQFKSSKSIDFSNLDENKFDVIIIHQTLLDEFFDNDIDKMQKFCGEIKKKIPLFVITSGRGQPDKLVENAKFLPFSNMDSFLIKEYHEKFLFTQVLMKLTRGKNG